MIGSVQAGARYADCVSPGHLGGVHPIETDCASRTEMAAGAAAPEPKPIRRVPDAIIIKGGITYGLSQAARTGLNRVGAAGTCLCIINRGATKTCNPRPPKANEGARLFGR
jgi:hypothetical protein